MLEQEKSSSSSFIGIFAIIIAVVFYAFFARDLAANRDAIAVDLDKKNAELEVFQNEEVAIADAQEELQLTGTVEQFTSLAAVPAGLNQDDVIRGVVEVAENYDILLNAVNFARSNSNLPGVGVLKINASFEGNYSDLIDFLSGLEQSERLFKVNSINVQIADTSISGLSRANFSLAIDTFYQL